MRTREIKAAVKRAIKALPEKITLTYVDYRESLSDENLAKVLGGQEDEVIEGLADDDDSVPISEQLNDALSDLDEEDRDAIRESDEYQDFVDACRDRDDSTVFADLLENCHRKMVRFYIGGEETEFEDSSRYSDAEYKAAEKKIADLTKLDPVVNADAFKSLVLEASYGGRLCVIGYVEVSDIYKAVDHLLRDESARVRMTFTDPQLLLIDTVNGSGYDSKVKGDIVIEFGHEDLGLNGIMRLDAKNVGTGYAWSDCAGTYNPAYKLDPKIELLPAPAAVTV